MGLFTNKKKGQPPHTWYPDILHWREGDKILCWNIAAVMGNRNFDWSVYHRYTSGMDASGKAMFTYKSVDEMGRIYLEDDEGHLIEFEFYKFIRKASNKSLKSRKVKHRVKESARYMELMQNFQQAFDELQEKDNHPKRLGEGNQEKE